MHSESKMAFLLVRHLKDLKPANEELAAYLSILQRISSDTVCGAIQGIWVDDEGVATFHPHWFFQARAARDVACAS